MNKRLAIIVPYRDRRKQLDIFIPHMDSFLEDKGIDYQIIVAEQRDDRPFNRGQLCNATFDLVKDDFDYFCFHDVNLLPLTDECDYSYPEKPTHLASIVDDEYIPYEEFIGGVFLINKEHFEQINGFSDEYWGWGFEDNDLLHRMVKKELPLENFIDISSVSKNSRYSFEQIYLHNNYIKKDLNKICFEENCCIEIENFDSIDDLTNNSFSFSIWANPKHNDYEQFLFTRPPIGFGITYTSEDKFKFTLWDDKSNAYVIEDYKDEWFYIGSDSEKEHCFTGDISEISFWNTNLNLEDVRTLYVDKIEDLRYNPLLFYRCDKGYGSFILDETPNENNGVFTTNTKNPNQYIARQKNNWHPTSKENPDYAYTGEIQKNFHLVVQND